MIKPQAAMHTKTMSWAQASAELTNIRDRGLWEPAQYAALSRALQALGLAAVVQGIARTGE